MQSRSVIRTLMVVLVVVGAAAIVGPGSSQVSASSLCPVAPPRPVATRGPNWVPRSFADLEALTLRIADDVDHRRLPGVSMAEWGPDQSTDKIAVILLTPAWCTGDIVLPQATVATAQHMFDDRYGSALIDVQPYSMPGAVND